MTDNTQIPPQLAAMQAQLDVPSETVPLPSLGLLYPVGHPLHACDTVDIRSMTTREEDILTSRALIKKGTVINELIKSCLIDKRIDPLDLVAGDRNALMVAIRITGYGIEYEAKSECSACEAEVDRAFDLAQLPIKSLEIEPVGVGLNEFQFRLPRSGKLVTFRFLNGRDELEMSQTTEKTKKLGAQTDNLVTMNLIRTIVSVDGNTDRTAIANFIRTMPALDSSKLREYVKNSEPGVLMKQEFTCPMCGHTEEVPMPMGVKFLWPNAG